MATTKNLLNGVNDVLIRLGYIKGNSGLLAGIVDSQRQTTIDLIIQSWNELIVELYSVSEEPLTDELKEGTITLVTDDRDYTLPIDLVQIRWPLINQTTGQKIHEYPGGYEQIFKDQPIPANFTGQPSLAAIRPIDGLLYLNTIPSSTEDGDIYTFNYDKTLLLIAADDLMPFDDTVYAVLILAATELVKRDKEKSFDAVMYKRRTGIALGLMTQQQQRKQWTPVRGSAINVTDPLEGSNANRTTR